LGDVGVGFGGRLDGATEVGPVEVGAMDVGTVDMEALDDALPKDPVLDGVVLADPASAAAALDVPVVIAEPSAPVPDSTPLGFAAGEPDADDPVTTAAPVGVAA